MADQKAMVHPYYPEGLVLSGNVFVPNDWNVATLVITFMAGWAVILGSTLLVVRKINPRLKASDQGLVLWFVLSGSIHLFFEGYFVLNHTRMGSLNDFFGQLWKEYALSDSRYLFSDPFVLCMETITAVYWGPLSFFTAFLIVRDSPFRYPIQALVSTGQFYGDFLYYTTSLFADIYGDQKFYRPEPYYFWFYFIFMNAFWILIPGLCVYSSIKETGKAFATTKKLERSPAGKKRS